MATDVLLLVVHPSEELHPIQVAGYARMSPSKKHRVFLNLMNGIRELKIVGLRAQHPEWSEVELRRELARIVRNGRT
ncbi:MAG: hypothetical protein C0518_14270 [Opitutus sp.]|nr:hypothetical protein [Opitutus sp.]